MPPKERRIPASSTRAEVAARRYAEGQLRAAVIWFRELRARWGFLTLAQLRQLSGLLAARADLLYRRADRVERGAAAPRLPKRDDLRQLAGRAARVGRADDPVTRDVLARLAELAEVSARWPSTTPRALRELARGVLRLSEEVATSRALPFRQPPPPARGRRPNLPLAQLLDKAARLGFADVEIARALEREGVEPSGPGSDEVGLAERWAAIIKSARARARRRQR